jgi:hypothetical protein
MAFFSNIASALGLKDLLGGKKDPGPVGPPTIEEQLSQVTAENAAAQQALQRNQMQQFTQDQQQQAAQQMSEVMGFAQQGARRPARGRMGAGPRGQYNG